MRKLLLATVATLGVSMGMSAFADAQVVTSSDDGQAASDDGQTFPTPGTVTVRLNGRFRFYLGVANQGAARKNNPNNGPASNLSTSAATVTTNSENSGLSKNGGYGIAEYARLYPGFDGVAANGLKYGASIEIRQDNSYPAGQGALGSASGANRYSGELYIRREWGYIGTDRLGTLRLGASDQPSSLFLTGTFENFNDGGLDGDIGSLLPGNVQLAFPFADQGGLYSTNKIVYVSPQFYGFDGGVSFEPNTSTVGQNNADLCGATPENGQFIGAGASVATAGCADLASTSTGDVARRRNTYNALLRYRGTFGPVGVAATAAYTGSGRVQDSGIQGSTANPKHFPLEDLSVGDFGLVVTYGGLSFGGHYQLGRYNSAGAGYGSLVAKGQPNASAAIAGATYTFGPVIVGASYLWSWSQGDQQTATGFSPANNTVKEVFNNVTGLVSGGQRLEQGLAAGATYSVAPGLAIYLSYIFQERKQNGFNFITGQSNNALNNKVDSSVAAIGTSFAW